jgi:hypothetical protein
MSALALPDLSELAAQIEAEHQAALRGFRATLDHALRCGELLIQAKAQMAHGQWLLWLEANVTLKPRQCQGYMRLAQNRDALNTQATAQLTIDEALALLASPKVERDAHALRVMGSSESSEWYTPAPIVERVVATLGEVDLDPSWHPESLVRASSAYTVADDGLAQRWSGRVYLNPPYGREIDAWIEKLVAEYEAGTVTEAIALVPARVDTEWFRRLDQFPRCFVYGRLKYANSSNPTPFPSAIVYLGENISRFVEAFGQVGSIFVRLAGEAAP